MDKLETRKRISSLQTKTDLLRLLNDLKADDLEDKAYPIPMKALNFYCNPVHEKRYRSFSIPKKSGGKRVISAPCRGLMSILTYLNVMFEAMYEPAPCVCGFAIGKSVVDNANSHVGKNYVFNLDMKDFFPSIQQARVWARLQAAPYNLKKEIANVIAGLCCMKTQDGKFVLPQGAPTSPILTNMICERLDRRLSGLAKRFGLSYSRYADDITFSSMQYVYSVDGDFMKELNRIVLDEHFFLNDKKTRLQKKNERQEVTGVTVNEKTNVTRRYVREIRQLLYIWKKYGYNDAYSKFYPKYKAEKGHVKKGEPVLENVLSGKLLYLKMVKGEYDTTYLKLREQFDKLSSDTIMHNSKGEELRYILTYELDRFIAINSIIPFKLHINDEDLQTTDSGNYKGKMEVNGEFMPVYISKGVLQQIRSAEKGDYSDMWKCYISLCESTKGRFWLIHRGKHVDATHNPAPNKTISQIIDIWAKKGLDKAIEVFENSHYQTEGTLDIKAILDIWEEKGADAAEQLYEKCINSNSN